MNKRQAKIYALEVASGILRAASGNLGIDEGMGDEEHKKIVAELERIASHLEERAERLRENTRRG